MTEEQTLAEILQEQIDYLEATNQLDRAVEEHIDEDDWIVNWYMRTRKQILDEIEDIKRAKERKIRTLKNRLRGLAYVYGQELQDAVGKLRGSKKGVTSDHGWTGWRMGKEAVRVVDEKAAWESAVEAGLIEAIEQKIRSKTVILEHFKETGELLDACEYVEPEERFSPSTWVDEEAYEALSPKGAP